MAKTLVPSISGSPQQYLSYFLNTLSCKLPKKSRFFQKKWVNLQNTKLLKTFIYARFPPFFICDNGYGSIDPLFHPLSCIFKRFIFFIFHHCMIYFVHFITNNRIIGHRLMIYCNFLIQFIL